MSVAGLEQAVAKMRAAGVSRQAIDVFRDHYAQLEAGATGFILEDDIEPLTDPEQLSDVKVKRRSRSAGAGGDGGHQAEQGSGHLDGDG